MSDLPVFFSSRSGITYLYDYLTNRIICAENIVSKNKLKKYFYNYNNIWKLTEGKDANAVVDLGSSKVNSILHRYRTIREQIRKCQADKILISKALFNQKISSCSNLVLKITDNCNFKCLYCYYNISPQERGPIINSDMPSKVAEKAIYYFFSLSLSENRVSRYSKRVIGFYGGEPLLRFDFIKHCVNYAKSLCFKDTLQFNITTNGSLLDEEKIKYFVENNFNLLISIDGPENEHNKCRTFSNGEGTFDIIWKNVRLIRQINPKYFYNNVSFNAVYTELHDLEKINNFFNKKLFKKNVLIVGKASRFKPDIIYHRDDLKENILRKFQAKYDFLLDLYLKDIITKKPMDKYLGCLFSPYFLKMEKRMCPSYKDRLIEIEQNPTISACFPGSVRLFVSTDGRYHICERINDHFSIGDYKKGIEYEKVVKIINNYYQQVSISCPFCEAVNICNACYATFCSCNKFERDKYCEKMKASLRKLLVDYVSIKEKDKGAFG